MSLERVQECYPTYALIDLRLKTEHHVPITRLKTNVQVCYQTYPRGLPQQKDTKFRCRMTEVDAISSKTLSAQSTSPTP